jgi:uncharacterized protein
MLLELETRSLSDVRADGQKIVGYPVVFDSLSEDLGGFFEVISPTAVDRTLAEQRDVRALVDHDPSKVIGRMKAGTLALSKDARGLRAEIVPPDTTVGRDILESVRRGDVTGMSFTFAVIRPDGERWEQRNGQPVRVVLDAVIPEVSIVTFPAYSQTDVQVAVRSLRAFTAQGQPRVDWLRLQSRLR